MTTTFSAADFQLDNGTSIGGGFFKAKDHGGAYAILFEPTASRPQVQSQWGPKDYVDGDFTVFATAGELDAKSPSTVLEGASTEGNLARSLSGYVGRKTVGKLGQKPTTKGNPAWIIESVAPEVQAKVIEYLVERENKKAATANVPTGPGAMPSFLQNKG